jgi:hypothetical protein
MTTIGTQQQTDKTEESLSVSQKAQKELADLKFALGQHAIVAMTDVQGHDYVRERKVLRHQSILQRRIDLPES